MRARGPYNGNLLLEDEEADLFAFPIGFLLASSFNHPSSKALPALHYLGYHHASEYVPVWIVHGASTCPTGELPGGAGPSGFRKILRLPPSRHTAEESINIAFSVLHVGETSPNLLDVCCRAHLTHARLPMSFHPRIVLQRDSLPHLTPSTRFQRSEPTSSRSSCDYPLTDRYARQSCPSAYLHLMPQVLLLAPPLKPTPRTTADLVKPNLDRSIPPSSRRDVLSNIHEGFVGQHERESRACRPSARPAVVKSSTTSIALQEELNEHTDGTPCTHPLLCDPHCTFAIFGSIESTCLSPWPALCLTIVGQEHAFLPLYIQICPPAPGRDRTWQVYIGPTTLVLRQHPVDWVLNTSAYFNPSHEGATLQSSMIGYRFGTTKGYEGSLDRVGCTLADSGSCPALRKIEHEIVGKPVGLGSRSSPPSCSPVFVTPHPPPRVRRPTLEKSLTVYDYTSVPHLKATTLRCARATDTLVYAPYQLAKL